MYQLIRAYNDLTSVTEHCDDIVSALNAAAIYLTDSECWRVMIVNIETGAIILNYSR